MTVVSDSLPPSLPEMVVPDSLPPLLPEVLVVPDSLPPLLPDVFNIPIFETLASPQPLQSLQK